MSEEYTIRDLLAQLVETNATDLIICSGQPPQVRVDKNLKSLPYPPLIPQDTKTLCYQVMNEMQQKVFEDNLEIDFSFGLKELARFRANVFMQRGSVSAAFRRIPFRIMTFDELGLPPVIREMADKPNGLIIVTGPTGSGKSTTLAAMVDRINETRHSHIITIEDPIEYLHRHKNCTIEQREIGADTNSFKSALKSILRQDPDVVLMGEMRDAESIQAALTIAETGHLCLSTLHTNSCSQTLSRIVDVFPGDKQNQIRTQLSMTLNCVVSQMLLPRVGGGLQVILEIMAATPAVRALIRENKMHNIETQMQIGTHLGMQTINMSLARAVQNGQISREDAIKVCTNKEDLEKLLIQ